MERLLNLINTNKTVSKLLRNCPYRLLSKMVIEEFKAKNFLLNQGEYYDFVYIVVSGELKIFVSEDNGREILLDIYGEGNFIGEQEAVLNVPYSSSIKNTTECLVIKIPNQTFLEWVRVDANYNYRLIESLCEQMYQLTNRAAKYSMSTVKVQVIKTLLDLEKNKAEINKKLLIQSISATARSVYRVLNGLEHIGAITIDAKTISINDRDMLKIERKKI